MATFMVSTRVDFVQYVEADTEAEAEFLDAWNDDNVMCDFKILGMADNWAGVEYE